MWKSREIDRRDFIKAAGITFLASLGPAGARALERTDAVFASGIRRANGGFAVATVSERGEIIDQINLPARAHGMAHDPSRGTTVAFARRPGTFALVFDAHRQAEPVIITSPAGRHFYGHGVFSPDGHLLYANENDFDNQRGVIGLYDARNGFERIGEFDTYGVGPHDVAVSDDGRMLIVANGGIETHPDFGRLKLNLDSMKPSLSLIDAATGNLIEKHTLPQRWSRLSTRHLDVAEDGRIWFACQYEGHRNDLPPLVGSLSKGEDLQFVDLPPDTTRRLANYVGAIAVNRRQGTVGITSPKGGAVVVLEAATGKVLREEAVPEAAGIAAAPTDFAVSSYRGDFMKRHSAVAWDQHIVRIQPLITGYRAARSSDAQSSL